MHEPVAGVGDQRHTGVRDQGTRVACEEAGAKLLRAIELVVVVIADLRRLDAVVVEQFPGLARIFAGDPVHLPEDAYGPIRYVFQVPDRRSNNVEDAAHRASIRYAARTAVC